MDWNKIHDAYPRAYHEYISWHHTEDCPSAGCYDHKDRDLYDFFDNNNLYCECSPKQALNDSVWFIGYIWSDIYDIGEYVETEVQLRSELEYHMFTKAFELLEEKLND